MEVGESTSRGACEAAPVLRAVAFDAWFVSYDVPTKVDILRDAVSGFAGLDAVIMGERLRAGSSNCGGFKAPSRTLRG
jgi:hypothetical protein